MAITLNSRFKISHESEDMKWFSIPEIEKLVQENMAQQRALEMATNSLELLEALTKSDNLPSDFSQ